MEDTRFAGAKQLCRPRRPHEAAEHHRPRPAGRAPRPA